MILADVVTNEDGPTRFSGFETLSSLIDSPSLVLLPIVSDCVRRAADAVGGAKADVVGGANGIEADVVGGVTAVGTDVVGGVTAVVADAVGGVTAVGTDVVGVLETVLDVLLVAVERLLCVRELGLVVLAGFGSSFCLSLLLLCEVSRGEGFWEDIPTPGLAGAKVGLMVLGVVLTAVGLGGPGSLCGLPKTPSLPGAKDGSPLGWPNTKVLPEDPWEPNESDLFKLGKLLNKLLLPPDTGVTTVLVGAVVGVVADVVGMVAVVGVVDLNCPATNVEASDDGLEAVPLRPPPMDIVVGTGLVEGEADTLNGLLPDNRELVLAVLPSTVLDVVLDTVLDIVLDTVLATLDTVLGGDPISSGLLVVMAIVVEGVSG